MGKIAHCNSTSEFSFLQNTWNECSLEGNINFPEECFPCGWFVPSLTSCAIFILAALVFSFLQDMALLLAPTWLLVVVVTIYIGLLRSTQAGAYYGIKQMPPQVPQYQALGQQGQQVPHMPVGKDGIPLQRMGKEGPPPMPYGKEYIPQFLKEIPPLPVLGKERISKKQKGNTSKWCILLPILCYSSTS